MYPAVRELKKEFGKEMVFVVADFRNDQTLQLATIYDVRYVPDFVIIDSSGKDAARKVGAMPKDDLRNMILQGLGR